MNRVVAPVPLVTDDVLRPGTRVWLGGGDVGLGGRNGARFTVGYSLNPAWAVEAVGLFLSTGTESRSVAGSGLSGSQDLLIPFFDPTVPGENVTNLSLAGQFSGAATETLRSRLWGIELNGVKTLTTQGPWRIELLGGVRYLRLAEEYRFTTSSPDLGPGPVSVFVTQDVFDATNDFYGAQLGLRAWYQAGNFMLGAAAKVAVGVVHQSVDVAGALVTNQFTIPVVSYAGGYFAQPTNMGSHTRTVARPGEQIDRTVNLTQSLSFGGPAGQPLVGEACPRSRFEGSDFWAHGLSAGVAVPF